MKGYHREEEVYHTGKGVSNKLKGVHIGKREKEGYLEVYMSVQGASRIVCKKEFVKSSEQEERGS
jgi:hypothetical protein